MKRGPVLLGLGRAREGLDLVRRQDGEVARAAHRRAVDAGGRIAGKTTTLRILLGLVRPTSGSARVLNVPPGSPRGLARVGALIETPADRFRTYSLGMK